MAEWDFSDWESERPPVLSEWPRQNLADLLDAVTDGRWRCDSDGAAELLWYCRAQQNSGEGLIICSAEQFKEAAIYELVDDYPTEDGFIWPTHKADVLKRWHHIRAAWGRALDEIDREVTKVLALPERERL